VSIVLSLALAAAARVAAAPAPAPAAPAARLRVAVVSLRAPPQLTFTGKNAAQAIASEARRAPGVEVLGPDEVERMLGRAGMLGLVECGEAPQCLSERSKPLGVDRVVAGALSQSQESYQVLVVHVDARTARVLSSFEREVPIASRRLAAEVAGATPALLRGEPGRRGVLEVVSDPPGAEVEIDGESAGRTPVRREMLPGKHSVRVTRSGYQVQEPTWVDVAPARVTQHQARLFPVPGAASRGGSP